MKVFEKKVLRHILGSRCEDEGCRLTKVSRTGTHNEEEENIVKLIQDNDVLVTLKRIDFRETEAKMARTATQGY